MKSRLESSLEKSCYQWAAKRGWFHGKWKSPGKRSRPDRIFARWCPSGLRVPFVEFKRLKKKPTPLQAEEHRIMRTFNLEVYVIDDRDLFIQIFTDIMSQTANPFSPEASMVHWLS